MDPAFARHERVHVAVPARSGSTAGAWVVTLRMMREAAVSLDPVVTWSVGCLVTAAGRAHDVNSRGERAASVLAAEVDEASFARRSSGRTRVGQSQEGESRALRVLLQKPHPFLTAWLPLYHLFCRVLLSSRSSRQAMTRRSG